MKVTLGKTYRDKITGYEGVATARCTYFTGCVQVTLEGSYSVEKNEMPSWWVDENRLELVRKVKAKKIAVKKKEPAGPQNSPAFRTRKA